jgi:CHAT domain-containing protein
LVLNGAAGDEGKWTAKEIQGLDLKAQIAILSACQTGLGKVHDAGIIGLARAFQLAGTPRVVMSLWNVSDEATRKLMVFLVSYLKNGVVPAEALRRAMVAYKKQEPDPAKWASFILFGTPR